MRKSILQWSLIVFFMGSFIVTPGFWVIITNLFIQADGLVKMFLIGSILAAMYKLRDRITRAMKRPFDTDGEHGVDIGIMAPGPTGTRNIFGYIRREIPNPVIHPLSWLFGDWLVVKGELDRDTGNIRISSKPLLNVASLIDPTADNVGNFEIVKGIAAKRVNEVYDELNGKTFSQYGLHREEEDIVSFISAMKRDGIIFDDTIEEIEPVLIKNDEVMELIAENQKKIIGLFTLKMKSIDSPCEMLETFKEIRDSVNLKGAVEELQKKLENRQSVVTRSAKATATEVVRAEIAKLKKSNK